MKKILFILVILISSASFAEERIISFNSVVFVNKDASMVVSETITVESEKNQIKHGIFRDFPTNYKTEDGKTKKVSFKVLEVLRDGRKEDYHLERISGGKRIYIGNKNRYISRGEHEYQITYETNRQIRYFENFDEVYWNVTGNGWRFPIDKTTATIKFPEDVQILNTHGYTGYKGQSGKDYTVNNLFFETTRRLERNEGFTVAVAFPKGVVEHPDNAIFFIEDTLESIFSSNFSPNLGILVFLFVFYLWSWNKVGRDPKKGTIIPRFYPPKDFSPAQVRELIKMDSGNKCFTVAIINMAVKGVIKIREEKSGLFGKKEFTLDKISSDTSKLSLEEKEAFDVLFKDGDSIELTKAKEEKILLAISMFDSALAEDKSDLYTANIGYSIFGSIITFIAYFIFRMTMQRDATLDFAILVIIVALNPIFAYLLKAPSKEGRKIMDEIEGFKMFLKTTEKHRFDDLYPPEKTTELFEKYLPYAIALDVENQWGKQFEDVLANAMSEKGNYYPAWHVGSSLGSFSSGSFAGDISSTLSSVVNTSTATSGSGGGGFSGGGGGGGGGGGW